MIKLLNLLLLIFGQNKTLNLIMLNYIPVTLKIFKKYIIDDYKCIHYTSNRHISDIKRLQNTKKAISCTRTADLNLFSGGIATCGGVAVTLKGKRLLRSTSDLLSKVDLGGRKWIKARSILENSKYLQTYMDNFFNYFIKKIYLYALKSKSNINLINETTSTKVSIVNDFLKIKTFFSKYSLKSKVILSITSDNNKDLYLIIKLYFNNINRIFTLLMYEFTNIKLNDLMQQKSDWDLILLSQFKIINIYSLYHSDDRDVKQINIKDFVQLARKDIS